MSMKILRCPECKTRNWTDSGEVVAVYVCLGCGRVLQFPYPLEGPGNRPAPGDARFEGDEEVMAELGIVKGTSSGLPVHRSLSWEQAQEKLKAEQEEAARALEAREEESRLAEEAREKFR